MKDQNTNTVLSQEVEDLRQNFIEQLRLLTLEAMHHVLEEERTALCGPSHHPTPDSPYVRAGTTNSKAILNGKRMDIQRPRVRKVDPESGQSKEVDLVSWKAIKDDDSMREAAMRATLYGVSTRNIGKLSANEVASLSKSQVSRLWQEKASQLAEELQNSDLSEVKLLGIMIDGVVLGKDQVVTVALGILEDGAKRFLGYQIGSSENTQVCKDLLNRLESRGLKMPEDRYLLAFVDDSKALKNALQEKYGDRLMIQGCLVHLQRNLRGYTARKRHGQLQKIMKDLRESQGEEKCQEHWKRLVDFMRSHNQEAGNRLAAQEEEMTCLIKLGTPNTINKSLLSTNCIENSFRNLRRLIGRVTRWREGCEMAQYWTGSGLKLAEEGFRKIRGCKYIPELIEKLKEKYQKEQIEKVKEEGPRP